MSAATQRWLALIGIGEDGLDGLSPVARRLIADAEFIVGGARHLKLAGSPTCETLIWPSPINDAIAPILSRRGRSVVVLASGDPFFYGVGSLIASHVPIEEIIALPAPSAFSLAACAAVGGSATLLDFPSLSLQPDFAFVEILQNSNKKVLKVIKGN